MMPSAVFAGPRDISLQHALSQHRTAEAQVGRDLAAMLLAHVLRGVVLAAQSPRQRPPSAIQPREFDSVFGGGVQQQRLTSSVVGKGGRAS